MPVEDDNIDTRSGTILNTSAIDGSSKALAITQQASVARSFYPLSLPTNASFFLVNTWRSKNVTIDFNGVSHYKDWITNGLFTAGDSPWVFKSSTANFANGTSPGNAQMTIANLQSYAKGAYGYFEENVTVPESLSSNKLTSISMDYYFFDDAKLPSENMSLLLSVTIGGVEKNISVHLTDLVVNSWTGLTLTYNPQTVGQILPGLMTIRAGIYTYNAATTLAKVQRLSIDNVRFNIWTGMNRNNSLVIRDNEFNQNYSYQNITTGTGRAFIGVERSRGTSSDVVFTIFKNSLVTEDVEAYNVTVTSFVEKQFNSTISGVSGSQYNAGGSSVNWTTYLNFVTPSSYISERALVGKPSDWNIMKITDGYGLDRVAACSGTVIGSNTMVIPKTILYDGLWKLDARSANYITSGAVQVWSGSVFNNKTSILVGDVFRVDTELNGTLNLAGSSIDCRIFYPNNSIYYENSSITPSSPTVIFGDITMGVSEPVGIYHVQVNWTNDLDASKKDKVGLIELEFQVIHHANITAITSYFQRTPGEPLLVKVKVMDTDATALLSSATVLFNTTYGLSGNMIYLGSGVYMAEVDTTSLALGDHYFSFNASKDGYLDCYGNNLVHLKIVSEPLKLEVPRDIKSVLANSYAIYRLNLTGSISQVYKYPANISTNWFRSYSVTGHDNGTYTLNLSTYEATSLSTPETFTINIYASKSGYGSTSDVVILTVYPINATLRMNSTYVEIRAGNQFGLDVNFTVDANGSLIAGATLTVTWPSVYQVQAAGSQYVITFNTTALDIGTYTGILRAARPGFQTVVESFFVVVMPVETELILLNPGLIEFSKGEDKNLTCRYLADGVDFLNGTLELRGDLNGTFQIAGSFYNFTVDTSLYAKGTYFVQVRASGPNVEPAVIDVMFSITPIPAVGTLNDTLLEPSLGDTVRLEAVYVVEANGTRITNASITISWPSNYTVSWSTDRYVITLDTWNLTMDTFSGMVTMEHPSYDVVFENFQVLVRPIKGALLIDNIAPYEFIKGDSAIISCRYIAGVSSLLNASVSISGDLSGDFTWNGSRYVFSFATSTTNASKTYYAQIIANKTNIETQIEEFIFRIVPLSLEINITTDISMTYLAGQENEIVFWIVDMSHNTNRTDLVVQFTVNSITRQVLPEPGGMYKISINQLNLEPSNTPILLHVQIINPYGENVASTITIVYTPKDNNNMLIIIVVLAVSGAFIAAISIYTVARRTRRRNEAKRMDTINKARDLFNLNNIIVLDKRSGIDIYGQTYGEFKLDPTLVSGFLSAIGTFGLELTNTDEDSQTIKLEYKKSKIVISEFKGFRITMIMKDAPSGNMITALDSLAHDIEMKYGKLLKDFNGETTGFQDMGELIEKHLHVSFIAPLNVFPRKKVTLTQDEKDIYNRATDVSMRKKMNPFYASELFPVGDIDPKAVNAFFSLMSKGIITPAK